MEFIMLLPNPILRGVVALELELELGGLSEDAEEGLAMLAKGDDWGAFRATILRRLMVLSV
jgi:hypothetical protein